MPPIPPLAVLREATRKVPAIRYAFGVPGISAAAAIAISLFRSPTAAFMSMVVMIVLMCLLYAFAVVVRSQSVAIRFAGGFLVFLSIGLFTVWAVMATLHVFFPILQPPLEMMSLLTGSFPQQATVPVDSDVPPPCVAMHGSAEFKSDVGGYIGGGQNQSLTENDGVFCATVNFNNEISINFLGDDYWNLTFAPPKGRLIAVGEYNNATRAAFHSPVKPGLDVSGAGRGCNTLKGSFSVHRVDYADDHSLAAFVADFEQRCEGGRLALWGTVRLQTHSVPQTHG